jgi:hypothetical protein
MDELIKTNSVNLQRTNKLLDELGKSNMSELIYNTKLKLFTIGLILKREVKYPERTKTILIQYVNSMKIHYKWNELDEMEEYAKTLDFVPMVKLCNVLNARLDALI